MGSIKKKIVPDKGSLKRNTGIMNNYNDETIYADGSITSVDIIAISVEHMS